MEKLEVFRKYEAYFLMVKDGYIKNHRKFISNEIADAYEKITKKQVGRNWSCGNCILKFYKEVGDWYFNELQKADKPSSGSNTNGNKSSSTSSKTNKKAKTTKKTNGRTRSKQTKVQTAGATQNNPRQEGEGNTDA